jgi:hypothetical protein
MLIVPIGNVLVQAPEGDVPDLAKQVMENIAMVLPVIIGRMLNKHLEMEITRTRTVSKGDAMRSAKKRR